MKIKLMLMSGERIRGKPGREDKVIGTESLLVLGWQGFNEA